MVASTRLFALVCAAAATVYALPLGSHPSRADTSGVLARRETTLIARSGNGRTGGVSVTRHGNQDSISSISSLSTDSTHRTTDSSPPTSREGSPQLPPPPNTPQANGDTLAPHPQTLATALNALLHNGNRLPANMAPSSSSPGSSRSETSTPRPSRQMVRTIGAQVDDRGREQLDKLKNTGK